MKISEIYKINVPNISDEDREDFDSSIHMDKRLPLEIQNFFKKHGFKKLGTGKYGIAYENPNLSYVLKIFDLADTGYLNFVSLVLANSNIHFPKFIGKPMKISNDLMAIRMEKLEKNSDGWKLFKEYLNHFMIGKILPSYKYNETTEEIIDKFGQSMIDALNLITTITPKNEFTLTFDIHPGNVMHRGNTPVIIDPFTS
jgi:hypothetical protein